MSFVAQHVLGWVWGVGWGVGGEGRGGEGGLQMSLTYLEEASHDL